MRVWRWVLLAAVAANAACGAGPSDAVSPDAALPDSLPPDAPQYDAPRHDAPLADASPIDASFADALPIDAGLADGSQCDASASDAPSIPPDGRIDGAPVDAWHVDTEPPDAPSIDALPVDSASCACEVDPYEPNDVPDYGLLSVLAQFVVNDDMDIPGSRVFPGASLCPTDEDYYVLKLRSGLEGYWLRATLDATPPDLQMSILNASLAPMGANQVPNGLVVFITAADLATGNPETMNQIWVRIAPEGSVPSCGEPYTLTLEYVLSP